MKLTTKELKHIYERLQDGKVFYGICKDGTISDYDCIYRAWNDIYHTEYCLAYQNYGSSAKSNTLEGLKFICEQIFDNYDNLYEEDR